MSNHNFLRSGNINSETEEYDGVTYRRDENGELIVIERVLPSQNLTSELMQVQEEVRAKAEKPRRFSKPTIFSIGTLAVTLVASPIAAHVAAESVTNAVLGYAKGTTTELTQEDLIEDLNISIRKMMGGS